MKERLLDVRAVTGVVSGDWLDLIEPVDWIPANVEVDGSYALECAKMCVPKGPWVCSRADCGRKKEWRDGERVWAALNVDSRDCEVWHWECHEKVEG